MNIQDRFPVQNRTKMLQLCALSLSLSFNFRRCLWTQRCNMNALLTHHSAKQQVPLSIPFGFAHFPPLFPQKRSFLYLVFSMFPPMHRISLRFRSSLAQCYRASSCICSWSSSKPGPTSLSLDRTAQANAAGVPTPRAFQRRPRRND